MSSRIHKLTLGTSWGVTVAAALALTMPALARDKAAPVVVPPSAPIATGAAPASSEDRYRLQVNDRLDLDYRYSPEYNESVTVQPDGYITLSLVGGVKLAGLTLHEAHDRVVTALKTRLNDPEITMTLEDFVHPQFTVMGQVGTPGKYDLRGDVNLLDAIAIAGGTKDKSQRTKIVVFRHLDHDHVVTQVVNMKSLLAQAQKGGVDDMITIHPGDFIMVHKTRASKVGDYVGWVGVRSNVPE